MEKYKMWPLVRVGRGDENDITLPWNQYISRKHCILYYEDGRGRIKNLSRNGLYVNGEFCEDNRDLHYGDSISLFGYKMIYLGEILGVSYHRDSLIQLEKKQNRNTRLQCVEKKPALFHRSPRNMQYFSFDRILIEKPPEMPKERRDSGITIVGPMFTMMIPMMTGSLFMIYAAYHAGEKMALSMFSGIVMAAVSGMCTIIWGLVQRFLSVRNSRQEREELIGDYLEYLSRVQHYIEDRYNSYRTLLNERYPGTWCYLKGSSSFSSLWNRNPDHKDFLLCRVGIGDQPFPQDIEIPSEDFRNYGTYLWDNIREVKSRYQTMYKIPILIDLRHNMQIGYAASEESQRMDFLRSLSLQIAAAHCYTEVKMVFVFNRSVMEDKDKMMGFRWLPHVWDSSGKTRYIASNREEARDLFCQLEEIFRERRNQKRQRGASRFLPHFVVFILESEYLEGDLLEQYFQRQGQTEKGSGKESLGLTGIWIAKKRENLPNSCSYILENNDSFCGLYSFEDHGAERKEIVFDKTDPDDYEKFVRGLSGVKVAEVEINRDIPEKISFFQMFDVRKEEELDIIGRWGENRAYDGLPALLGFGAGSQPCYLDISEKCHGPHGLVAGTTGSGKSEMLQTFILSMAVNYSPVDVNFFIIDYKGGGMADFFETLPHLCGHISNLSGSLIKRAMISVTSENLRRQRLFKKSRVNNINDYQRMYYRGEVEEAIPHLIIIIDEFAELKKEEPEFMKELISLAQVGRSLGTHLILSTQKPGGTVDERIWSNARFRICLRVQDRQDSIDMLHHPDAAFITHVGRGYFQVGNDEILELFQSGWSGASVDMKNENGREACIIGINGRCLERGIPKRSRKEKEQTQLEAVRDYIIKKTDEYGCKESRKLWMEPLGKRIIMEDVLESVSEKKKLEEGRIAILGSFDNPAHQKQPPYLLPLSTSGHILLSGMTMSGKSTFLQTMLFSLFCNNRPDQIQAYGIDFGGGMIKSFEEAPHMGAVAGEEEKEKAGRILKYLERECQRRKKELRGTSYPGLEKSGNTDFPRILMVIDNYPLFREVTSDQYEKVIMRLAKEGEKTGILLILSGSGISVSEVPVMLSGFFKTKICLAQKDIYSYGDIFGLIKCPVCPERGIPGRGVALCGKDYLEFQTALCVDLPDDYERNEYLKRKGREWSSQFEIHAESVSVIPRRITRRELKRSMTASRKKWSLSFGYQEEDARLHWVNVDDLFCVLIIISRGSLRTSLGYFIRESLYTIPEREVVLITGDRFAEESDEDSWRIITTEEDVYLYFEKLSAVIEKRAAGDYSPEKDRRYCVVIQDMKSFVDMIYQGEHKMAGFFENIWEKGQRLGLLFLSVCPMEDLSSLAACPAFKKYVSWRTGLQAEGSLIEAGIFDGRRMEYMEKMQVLPENHARFFYGDGGMNSIVIPPCSNGDD